MIRLNSYIIKIKRSAYKRFLIKQEYQQPRITARVTINQYNSKAPNVTGLRLCVRNQTP